MSRPRLPVPWMRARQARVSPKEQQFPNLAGRGKWLRTLHSDPTLLAELYEHDRNGYGPWGSGLRHRVEDALGMHEDFDNGTGRTREDL